MQLALRLILGRLYLSCSLSLYFPKTCVVLVYVLQSIEFMSFHVLGYVMLGLSK